MSTKLLSLHFLGLMRKIEEHEGKNIRWFMAIWLYIHIYIRQTIREDKILMIVRF